MGTKITIRTRPFLHQEEAPLHRVSLLGGDFFRHRQRRRHGPHAVMAKLCPGGMRHVHLLPVLRNSEMPFRGECLDAENPLTRNLTQAGAAYPLSGKNGGH